MPMLFTMIPVILLFGFFALLINTSTSLPLYYLWDMDHILQVDLLLINSGTLPTHINHPGFGGNLLYFLVEKIGHIIHWLPLYNLESLQKAHSPYLMVFDHIHLLRQISPYLVMMTILNGAWWMKKKFQLSPLFIALFLLGLILQEALVVQAGLIRSELSSWFFFSFFLVTYEWSLIAAGFFATLAVLSKLQMLFLVGLILLQQLKIRRLKPTPLYQFFNIINISFFLFCLLRAHFTSIHDGFATFAQDYNLNGLGMMLFFLHLLPFRYPVLTRFFIGFHLAFLTHFLLYENLAAGLLYLFFDYKVLFLRHLENQFFGLELLNNFPQLLKISPILWSSTITAIVLFQRKKIFHPLHLMSLGIFLIHLVLTCRPILRDLIWWQVPLWTILFIVLHREKMGKILLTIVIGFISLQFSPNRTLTKMKFNYNQYGFKPKIFTQAVFGGWRYPYEEIFQGKQKEEHLIPLVNSLPPLMEKLQFLFYYPHLALPLVSMPNPQSARVFIALDELIKKIPPHPYLENARDELIDQHSEAIDKFNVENSSFPAAEFLTLPPRSDLDLVLYAPQEVLSKLKFCPGTADPAAQDLSPIKGLKAYKLNKTLCRLPKILLNGTILSV